ARFRLVFVYCVGVRIAEKQISAIANPDGPFGELKSLGQLVDLGIRRNDCVDRGVQPKHLHVHFARWNGNGAGSLPIKRELRAAHEDEIGRGIGNGSIDAEHSKLDLLYMLQIASYHQPIAGVPAADYRSATLSESLRKFAVHPDLGIIV